MGGRRRRGRRERGKKGKGGRGEDGGRDLAPSPKINFGVATMANRVPQSLNPVLKNCVFGAWSLNSVTPVGLNEQSYVDNITLR